MPLPLLAQTVERLKRFASPHVKGFVRRNTDLLFPGPEVRAYRQWMEARLLARRDVYTAPLRPGLLSVLTPVWDGSPVRFLRELARSILGQDPAATCEWVILDNGCSRPAIRTCLKELSAHAAVKVHRLPTNTGITPGLRACLEQASGQYVLPVDADDLLYPDALRVITSAIDRAGAPPLLYTDEDKVIGHRNYQPYCKPDWDPVLLLNSAYIAHLGVVHRQTALALGAYTDRATEGSPDWDLFMRFLLAGHCAVHIPEVIYSWRVHASSTADDAASKPYIASSQRSVLERFIGHRDLAGRFTVERNELFGGGAHFHLVRQPTGDPPAFATVLVETETRPARLAGLRKMADELAAADGFLFFKSGDLSLDSPEEFWEIAGLFELHADAVAIGGRVMNPHGPILDAGRIFGFDGPCGSPEKGRAAHDPGYFGNVWKQRSVSAVSTQLCAIRARFLRQRFDELPPEASAAFLGAWISAWACEFEQRVIYTPFLSGVSTTDWDRLVSPAEEAIWRARFAPLIPDRRFYSPVFSLVEGYRLPAPV